MIKWTLTGLLILSCFNNIDAQTIQKLYGKVLNNKNEPLVGVSIVIEGSTTGTSTDVEGRFSIATTLSTVNLIFSAVGYSEKKIGNVETKQEDLIVIMEAAGKKLENVVVTAASTKRETVNALIAYQKNTSTVSQVISAEAIKRSPDKNTGEVLKRIPGTSIQEGKYLVVRGLSDRYNQAMLNGVLLSSTEPDRKTFSFDIFPSAMIDNIIINKSFIPELSGEWAGGLIQVNTKDIPSTSFLNIQAGTGFNSQTIGNDFYTYKGGKYDFLGIDDGTRALPASLPTKSAYNNIGNGAAKTEFGKLFKNIWAADKTSSNFLPVLNKSFQINGGFNKRLKNNMKLGAIYALTYNQSVKRTDFTNRVFNIVNNQADISFDYSNKKYSRDVLWGGLGNITLQINNNHKVSFKNILNVNATNYVTERTGKDFEFDPIYGENIKATELALKTNTFFNTQLSGDHNFQQVRSKLHWYGSFTILDQYIPDQRRIQYNQDPTIANAPYYLLTSASPSSQRSGSRYFGTLSDYIYNAGADASTAFNLFGYNQTVKAGYFFQVKDRIFNSRPFAIYIPKGENKTLQALPADQIFSEQNFGNGFDNKFAFSELAGDQYRYIANSILNAGFIQLDNSFTDKLRATYGVRVEHFDQVVGSMKQSDRRHVHSVVTDWLPGFNLTYKLNSQTNIRLSGSQTVIRPEFRELSTFQFFDFDLGATVAGNTSLKRTKVSNADIRYEYYPRPGELITAGLFYKYFNSPLELYFNQTGAGSSSTFNYINADKATGYGVEFELRKKLDFSNILRRFTFQTNLAYIYNRVQRGSSRLDRPMQGQSPYVINASLQYDVEKAGINATLLFNQIGDRIFYVGGDQPPVWEASRPVFDFQIAKKVMNNAGEIKFSVSDILNRVANFYQDLNDNRKYDNGVDALTINRRYGSNFSFTFSYKIK